MQEEILDYFEQNGETPEIVVFRYFTFESEAYICAARLREENIPCFISNSYMSTVLPLGGTSEVRIYLRLSDLEAAEYIFKAMESLDNQALIHKREDDSPMALANGWMANRWVRYFFILLIVLLLLRACLRAKEIMLWQLDSF
jgi:hypothetical protein